MRLSEPTTKIWMKIVPHYPQQKCRPMTVASGSIRVYADIRGGSLGMGHQTTVGLSRTAIFIIFAGYFSETLETRPALLHSDMQSDVSFSVISKYVTLNDSELLFCVKLCFRTGLTKRHSKNNCTKTNKDRHIMSAAQIFDRDSSFWRYKVCADIRSRALTLVLNTFSWLSKTIA